MSNKKKRIDEEVNATFAVMGGIDRVECDAPIYQRVRARIAESESGGVFGLNPLALKLTFTMVALLIIFNIFTVFNPPDENEAFDQEITVAEFSEEFNLMTVDYEY